MTTSVYDVGALVRTLYYNETQAFNSSSAAGVAFIAANDYPGVFDTTSAAWNTGSTLWTDNSVTEADVPDVSTIQPDPAWLLSVTKCSVAQSKPSPGRTYILTVESTQSQRGYAPETQKVQSHVTLEDGKMYFYMDMCG